MSNWIHRLFNPHCAACMADKEESKICDSCEAKNQEIARLILENERLLNHILNPAVATQQVQVNEEELKPIMPKFIPWPIRKRMLEEQNRAEALAKANASKSDKEVAKEVEELEEALLDTNIPTEVALLAEGSD